MTKNLKPNIIDVTLSEGGFMVNHHLLPEQVTGLVKELEAANLRFVEVCHGMGIGSFRRGGPGLCDDKTLLEEARNAAPKLHYGIYVPTIPSSLMEMDRFMDLFEWARVKVNFQELSNAVEPIKKLKNNHKQVIAQLMRVQLYSPSEVAEVAHQLQDIGTDIFFITDNFGSMNPGEIKTYVEAIKNKTQSPIGFQGRNSMGQATANAMAAIESGAEWLDASLLGMGRGAGIAPLEILVALLQRRGLRKDLNLEGLTLAAKWHVFPAMHYLPMVTYMDLLFAKYKIDYYPSRLLEKLADILEMDPENLLLALKKFQPQKGQIKDDDIRTFLAKEKLDFDVVMNFIKTGKISEPTT